MYKKDIIRVLSTTAKQIHTCMVTRLLPKTTHLSEKTTHLQVFF